MKIHPGLNDIISTDKINTKSDVQIAYITTESYEPTVTFETTNTKESFTPLIPYETFDKNEMILFDEKRDIIPDPYNYIIRNGEDKYQYVPKNIVSYIKPDEFNYRIIGKRNESFNRLKNYYLDIRAYNDKFNNDDTNSLFNVLKTIFLDAASRGLCPENIITNQNDQAKFIFDSEKDKSLDFCFIKSNDGITVDGVNIAEIDALKNMNLWIITSDANIPNQNNPMTLYNYDGKDYNFSINPIIYNTLDYTGLKIFLADKYSNTVDPDMFTYSDTMYAPVCLKKDPKNNRYLIYSPASLFDNLTTSKINIIYEFIIRIYLSSYVYSKNSFSSWIADEMPDYIVKNHKLTKQLQFISPAPYYEMINESRDTVSYVGIDFLDNTNISASLDASDYIIFNKIQKGTQAKKPEDCISIYCHNKTIIYYKDNVYFQTTNLLNNITYSLNTTRLTVSISKYIDSYNNIDLTENTADLIISPDTNSNILVVIKNNKMELINETKYTTDSGYIIGTVMIRVNNKKEQQIYDIRLRGGGLQDSFDHDFQCLFDVGSIKGMSYRKAGSVIIRIPLEFKQFDKQIRAAINKHKSADEYAIVLYY